MTVSDVLYQLIDDLTAGADVTLEYDVTVLGSTPTSVTAKWEALLIRRLECVEPEDSLPAIGLPNYIDHEERTIFLEWKTKEDKDVANSHFFYKWLEGETGWARISWDDPRVKEFDVSVAFESVIDQVAMGIKISEWYEIEDPYDDEHKLKLSDFPKKLRPYVEDWLSSAF